MSVCVCKFCGQHFDNTNVAVCASFTNNNLQTELDACVYGFPGQHLEILTWNLVVCVIFTAEILQI